MSTREWRTGDPQPADRPPLVDNDDVTWLSNDGAAQHAAGTLAAGVQKVLELLSQINIVARIPWEELLERFGPMREATFDEAVTVIESWPL